jgi:hypothetical protein
MQRSNPFFNSAHVYLPTIQIAASHVIEAYPLAKTVFGRIAYAKVTEYAFPGRE